MLRHPVPNSSRPITFPAMLAAMELRAMMIYPAVSICTCRRLLYMTLHPKVAKSARSP